MKQATWTSKLLSFRGVHPVRSVRPLAPFHTNSIRALPALQTAVGIDIYGQRLLNGVSQGLNERFPKRELCSRPKATPVSQQNVVQFKLSDIGEGIAEVNIKEWYVTEGQRVSQFDSICEVQSDKASVTITSKFDGIIRKLHYGTDEVARVGQPLVDIEVQTVEATTGNLVDEIEDQDSSGRSDDTTEVKGLATPAVRRIAMENNVTLSQVRGTGKHGRVMKEDILSFLQSVDRTDKPRANLEENQCPVTTASTVTEATLHVTEVQMTGRSARSGGDQRAKMSPIAIAMFKSMTDSLRIPHLSLGDDLNADRLLQMKPLLQEHGITFLSLFLKACSHAFTDFPILNSCLSDEGNGEVILRADHNIGFAVDTPAGLVVPNVKRVQDKSICDISQEIRRLVTNGKENKSKPEDLSHGTFTLSNIGSIGGAFGIPVVLSPQVAIGAIGRLQTRPVFSVDGNIQKSSVMEVVWSADHRVIDGATMARFSNKWISLLEQPDSLLLHLK